MIGFGDCHGAFLFRHAFTFAVFLAGLWGLYRAGRRWFAHQPVRALVPVVLLVLQPRVYADAFYNGKDVGFLAVLCIALWTGERLRERPGAGRVATHALVCGFLVAIRVIGAFVPLADLALYLLPAALRAPTGKRLRAWLAPLGFGVATYLFTVLCWPALWTRPLGGLWAAVADAAHFGWNEKVLFAGRSVPAASLPRSYLPVWIGLTTPVLVLLLAAVGLWVALEAVRRPGARSRRPVLRLSLVFLPAPTAAVLLHSVMYDGWRHFYFLAVGLAILAGAGFWRLWDLLAPRRPLRAAFAAAAAVGALSTAHEMAALHPYQNLYFSEWMGRAFPGLETRYEMDYWGLTYRAGLSWIAAHDDRPELAVWCNTVVCKYTLSLLPPEQRARFAITEEPDDADYRVTNYRWQPLGFPGETPLYEIRVHGARALTVVGPRPAAPAGGAGDGEGHP